LLKPYYQIVTLSQKQLDIRDEQKVNEVIQRLGFDYFLHLAAYTDVNASEVHKQTAYDINVKGTEFLFSAIKSRNKPFIYVSTDFVFDGENPPFTEKSHPNPINYYGKTKFLGEKIVGKDGIIARLSYPFGKKYPLKKDIVHTIAKLLKTQNNIYAVHDNLITLTYIDDIAAHIHTIIERKTNDIYHISGNESVSSIELFRLIAEILKIKVSISPIDFLTYYKNRVPRPQYAQIKTVYTDLFTYTPLDIALRNALTEE
jgi:dTDP-4-dehydrorhamnose reductase